MATKSAELAEALLLKGTPLEAHTLKVCRQGWHHSTAHHITAQPLHRALQSGQRCRHTTTSQCCQLRALRKRAGSFRAECLSKGDHSALHSPPYVLLHAFRR